PTSPTHFPHLGHAQRTWPTSSSRNVSGWTPTACHQLVGREELPLGALAPHGPGRRIPALRAGVPLDRTTASWQAWGGVGASCPQDEASARPTSPATQRWTALSALRGQAQ